MSSIRCLTFFLRLIPKYILKAKTPKVSPWPWFNNFLHTGKHLFLGQNSSSLQLWWYHYHALNWFARIKFPLQRKKKLILTGFAAKANLLFSWLPGPFNFSVACEKNYSLSLNWCVECANSLFRSLTILLSLGSDQQGSQAHAFLQVCS